VLPTLRATAFSPDGRIIAVSDETDPVRLWDVLTGRDLFPLQAYPSKSLCFSADGLTLALTLADRPETNIFYSSPR
jgi:WD40 repeat protein